jgi:hypothetical protein
MDCCCSCGQVVGTVWIGLEKCKGRRSGEGVVGQSRLVFPRSRSEGI